MSTLTSPQQEPEVIDRSALDPAQKSLADALRITYRIIQFVMVILFGLFVLSGFETVGEGERGVKLAFGAIKQSDLPPGQQFHLPYPVGELVAVHTGSNEIRIDRPFYPGRNSIQPPNIRAVRSLKPGEDGSMLTGDGAIVHAQWSVVYRVDEAGVSSFIRNIQPEETHDLVRAAVMQGAVRVVAGLTVDQFLKQSSSDSVSFGEAAIETRVREVAQRTLERMNSGVRIERVTLDDRSPPGAVKGIFDEVSRQTSEASKDREEAGQYARELLNATAGPASRDLIELIDEFEALTDLGQIAEAEAVLDRIDDIFISGVVETDGQPRIVSGEVTRIISQAQQYRTDVVTQAQAAADRFRAKLELFRDNPAVFVSSEWSGAYADFLKSSSAEIFALPAKSGAEILLNRDPDIVKEGVIDRNTEQATENIMQRRDSILNQRRNSNPGS